MPEAVQPGAVELSATPSGLGRAAVLGLLRRARPDRLPDTTLVLRGVVTDLGRLAAYDKVCGYRLADATPATWPHVLAFPLAMKLMADKAFPFPVIGVVHVANQITQLRPLSSAEPVDLAVHADNLRPHERGQQFDILATGSVAGVEVWRGVSTYLRKGPTTGERVPRPSPAPPPRPSATWRIGRGVGPAYAAVSGDHNPIHTSWLGARAFGFARPIAHGMWSLARCLAALEGRLPDAYTVDAAFKLPILLPATVAFAATAATTGAGWQFALHDARTGKPHLTGAVRP